MTAVDCALDIKPRDVLGPRILAFVFRQDASSSASFHHHTDLLSCLEVDVARVDHGRPTPFDSFSLHILLEGFVMTSAMIDSTAGAIVDFVLKLATGVIFKMLRLDLRAGVKVVLRPTQTVD